MTSFFLGSLSMQLFYNVTGFYVNFHVENHIEKFQTEVLQWMNGEAFFKARV